MKSLLRKGILTIFGFVVSSTSSAQIFDEDPCVENFACSQFDRAGHNTSNNLSLSNTLKDKVFQSEAVRAVNCTGSGGD